MKKNARAPPSDDLCSIFQYFNTNMKTNNSVITRVSLAVLLGIIYAAAFTGCDAQPGHAQSASVQVGDSTHHVPPADMDIAICYLDSVECPEGMID
jgi:hypothetical protein